MIAFRSAVALLPCSFVLSVVGSCASDSSACNRLQHMAMPGATVDSAVMVEAGPRKLEPAWGEALPNVNLPAHCEVSGTARPTSDSEIRFVLWLPTAEIWNGKYMQRGNGGWAGSLPVPELITPLLRGYAVAATDDGHQSSSPMPDASWAIGHPGGLWQQLLFGSSFRESQVGLAQHGFRP